MKKHVSGLARLLMAAALVSGSLSAADGTITLTGEIKASTCTISSGTSGAAGSGADFVVALDNVQAGSLAGGASPSKDFFISVGGAAGTCADNTKVAVLFERSSPAINPVTGNLSNTAAAPAAANVEVQIIDTVANTPIDLGKGQASTVATVTGGKATVPFAARYVAHGGVAGPGAFKTEVQYWVTYP
ncbi:type 1 fimbrial protein [Pseudomonas yamanorum]|jgi:major type 1 subunit fimbrin (pilin)|uniref:Type 1 fimbrial protein n=1 Tax=Pseudomonas yamanorum TaxID=515393 RepID=A0A7Y8ELV9_9PSED|nr:MULTISPECIES: fimbrial protein [Pseudomonas]NVZ84481.1 type 1 fimbrial protein [Pseudomonas yamanorum]NWE17080.1 type 1 fimbrial protein [Pseudomonas yamanorum]NWE42654.1 type 1 fimbrial protein [Pseudomonas yamanorum]NWE78246.1 type 1 fimbrial protein [Pseudomonas yamanorum]